MRNDKAFTVYALVIGIGVLAVISAALLTGGRGLPPVPYMIEHILLGVTIRAAYKSFDGPGWIPRAFPVITTIFAPKELEPEGAAA